MKKILLLCTLLSLVALPSMAIRLSINYFEHHGKMYYGVNGDIKDGQIVLHADIDTFEDMGAGYGKDSRRIYYRGKEMYNISPHNMRLEGLYLMNNNTVYYEGKLMRGVHRKSFEVLSTKYNWCFAKDKKHVFKDNQKLSLDAATFKLQQYEYYTDKNGVYYGDRITKLEDANPDDILFDDEFLFSNKHIYLYGSKTPYDYQSFEFLDSFSWAGGGHSGNDGRLVKDKDRVYLNFRVLDVDISTFKYLGKRMYKDKNGVYFKPFYSSVSDNPRKLSALDPATTHSQVLTYERDDGYVTTHYLVADQDQAYIFEDEAGMSPMRLHYGIDWKTFEPYLKTKRCKYFRDKNEIYDFSRFRNGLAFRKTDMPTNSELIYFDEDKAILKCGSFLVYPNLASNNTYIDGATFVHIPPNKVLEKMGLYRNIFFLDKDTLYNDSGYQQESLTKEEYRALYPYVISKEKWEERRLATLENEKD